MATWEDGPEYAPRMRPNDFVPPEIEPLKRVDPAAHLSQGAPVTQPERFDRPRIQQVPLDQIAPEEKTEQRDPRTSFAVDSAVVTSANSAWGAARHSDHSQSASDPQQPILLADRSLLVAHSAPQLPAPAAQPGMANPWGPPQMPPQLLGAPVGYPPSYPTPWQPAQPSEPATFKNVCKHASTGLIITLLLSTLVNAVAPMGYLVAFILSLRITRRPNTIRGIFVTGVIIIALATLGGLAGDAETADVWWGQVGATSSWMSGLTLIAVLVVVWLSLKSNEGSR